MRITHRGEANLLANIGHFMPWMELLNFMHRGSAVVPRHFPASHPENRRGLLWAWVDTWNLQSTPSSQNIPKVYQINTAVSLLFLYTDCIMHTHSFMPGSQKSKLKANSSSNASVSTDIMVASERLQECMFVLAIHHYVSSPCIKEFIIIIIIYPSSIIIIIIILLLLHLSFIIIFYSKVTAEVFFMLQVRFPDHQVQSAAAL